MDLASHQSETRAACATVRLASAAGLYTELLQNGLKTAQRAPLVISARCRYGAEPAVAAGTVHA